MASFGDNPCDLTSFDSTESSEGFLNDLLEDISSGERLDSHR